jgi:hypothetical protein
MGISIVREIPNSTSNIQRLEFSVTFSGSEENDPRGTAF